jgi:hypothetical protein
MTKLVPCKKTTDCYYQDGHPGSCDYPKWPSKQELDNLKQQEKPKQIGGDHYETMAIQPWEVIRRGDLDFWEGNVIKYVMRYRAKNGLEDLEKARHYLDYLIDREKKNGVV